MQQTNYSAYLIIRLGNRWTDILRLQPGQSVYIGRSSECQVVVRDERVSRKHAEVANDGGWVVRDLGSRNGTQVDGRSIAGPHRLQEGETIGVGGCQMTFTTSLSSGFSNRSRFGPQADNAADPQATVALTDSESEGAATIVKRLSSSQWSSDGLDAKHVADALGVSHPSAAPRADEKWNFFYRLVFDLVACQSPEQAAQVALDRLLGELQLSSGGVVTIEDDELGARPPQRLPCLRRDWLSCRPGRPRGKLSPGE